MGQHSRPGSASRRLRFVATVAAVIVVGGAITAVLTLTRSSAAQGRVPAATAGHTTTTVPPATTGHATTTVPPATTTTAAPTSVTGPITPPAGGVTAIGDSIMIDIEPYLTADVPGIRVDGKVSRQFETGIGIVQADHAAGTLGSVLVVELGTNGTVTTADFDAMMQAAAGVKRVVFVNVDVNRSWAAGDNQVLAAGVARYPGVAVLADWYSESIGNPSWFTPDGVHLEPAGAQALAALITSKI
jgi:hypothetical protein